MASVEITELAQADLVDVWTYIAIDDGNAADHVLDVIDREAHSLALQPLMGRARPELCDGLRYWPTSVSYNLYYLPTQAGIVVVRVLHQSRDVQSGEFFGVNKTH